VRATANSRSHPQSRHHRAGLDTSDQIIVAAVTALFCLGSLLWLTGELAGRLFGDGSPGAEPSELVGIALRFATDPTDPAAAWPRGSRSVLPGPLAFYSCGVVLLALAVAGATGLWRLWRSLGEARPAASEGGSRWATAAELKPLIVSGPGNGRLILGRCGRKLLAAEARHSVIVLGPTQSRKTTGFAIPALLEWDGPVIATSVKTDLLRDTLAARRQRGEVLVYDPTGSTSYVGATWSPLAYCTDWRGAQRTASWLTEAARAEGSGLEDSEFWYQAAAKLLAPLLYAAAATGGTIGDVVRWVDIQDESDVRTALIQANDPAALQAAAATWNREERAKSSVYTTAETVLAAYADPVVAASAESHRITPERLLDGRAHTLYVVAPSHEQRRLRPLFQTVIASILSTAYERASENGGRIDPALLVVLDEAANIAPLRDLDTLASTAAGQGIQLVSVFQDLAQVSARYGERAATVVNNHRAKVLLSGISDPATLEYAARLLGDEEVMHSSVTRGERGEHSTTESTGYRSLAPVHVLRGVRPGEGVLVYGHLPPSRLTLRPT
jgi:type IV secretion system protein VirD4